jgi:16S rRNA (adenine1518-N6/adenine1519-N6)-dimethyltransferase
MGAKLGQHYLKHGWAARALAHAANPQPGETIVEIGPGKGILTKELLILGDVIAIEKDTELLPLLRDTFAEEIARASLRLVPADIRDVTPESLALEAGKYVVAANIPYYITGEIMRQFLTAARQPRAMALLVQKEVAQRMVSKSESILSLSVKAYGTPQIIKKVPRGHFSPAPKVDSAIVLIDQISRSFFDSVTEENFFAVVKIGFASKRKYLLNNLAARFEKAKAADAMHHAQIAQKARAENVSLEQWKTLAMHLI